ncbi:MAG: PfaD family polyunsaturated fatty acid/polyketide biosynthesis protein [Anaerolineaceae bacterium]|nr:PfaD family polyunsaturated fatty acid/polyketide biosynthesis protein [Anaerolineaceae bacterium]
MINHSTNSTTSCEPAFPFYWQGSSSPDILTADTLSSALRNFSAPLYILTNGEATYLVSTGTLSLNGSWKVLAFLPPFLPESLGDAGFKNTYGTRYALYGGSMANGIASEEMVIALGQAGFMGSFGAGGLSPARVEKAIQTIRDSLPGQPYAFNLINSPFEPALEQHTAELYVKYNVPVIEASAYLGLTSNLVLYRATGLSTAPDGAPKIGHRIIAKVSRKEVASKFLSPAPMDMLNQLVTDHKITPEQAALARLVPMADDITVEADSGGHTDNRPLVSLIPVMLHLRDSYQEKYHYLQPVRVGAAGGISTPESAIAAFMMGAAYVTTGSINQSCLESATSEHTRNLLAQIEMTDVTMAPASDMFEMGVKVQVVKRGTMFAMRAQKLYDLYQKYDSIDDIPADEREKLESTIFKASLDEIWQECLTFFGERDPKQIDRANQKPKDKMALIFRWYLGLSSRWSNTGEKGREMDYQIWCGPSMGAFNDWVRGTYLESFARRHAAEVNRQLLDGAAYLFRVRQLEAQGVRIPETVRAFIPRED